MDNRMEGQGEGMRATILLRMLTVRHREVLDRVLRPSSSSNSSRSRSRSRSSSSSSSNMVLV